MSSSNGSRMERSDSQDGVKALARIDVMLKAGISDVQGQVVERSLPAIGFENVRSVRVGKHLELEVEGASLDAVRAEVEQMCDRFLANTVIESYAVTVEPLE